MARILSSDHLAKYLKGGVYYDFLQYVKSDKELAVDGKSGIEDHVRMSQGIINNVYAPNTIQDRTAFDVYVEYETFKTRTGCKYRASTKISC